MTVGFSMGVDCFRNLAASAAVSCPTTKFKAEMIG